MLYSCSSSCCSKGSMYRLCRASERFRVTDGSGIQADTADVSAATAIGVLLEKVTLLLPACSEATVDLGYPLSDLLQDVQVLSGQFPQGSH